MWLDSISAARAMVTMSKDEETVKSRIPKKERSTQREGK